MQQDSATEAANPAEYFPKWRTWQISDHMPMWVELRTDLSDAYLNHTAIRVIRHVPPLLSDQCRHPDSSSVR